MLAIQILISVALMAAALGHTLGRPGLGWSVLWIPIAAILLVELGLSTAPDAVTGPYGHTRIVLTAMRFALPEKEAISVGGDAQTDDMAVVQSTGAAVLRASRGRLAPGILLIRSVEGGDRMDLGTEPAGRGGASVIQVKGDSDDVYLGAVAAPALRACDSPCSESGAASLKKMSVYDVAQYDFFDRGGRHFNPPGPFVFTMSDAGSPYVWRAQAGRTSYLLPYHDKAAVGIFEIEHSSPRRGNGEGQPGRVIAKRSFSVQRASEGANSYLEIRLDTPQTREVSLERGGDARLDLTFDANSARDVPLSPSDATVNFSLLGHKFDPELAGIRLEVPRRGDLPLSTNVARGRISISGRTAVLGRERRAVFQVDTLDFNSPIFALVRGLTPLILLVSALLTFDMRRRDAVMAIALGLLEFLLSMRLLIAIEGSFVDASEKAQMAVPSALVALAFGPALVACASPLRRQFRNNLTCLSALAAIVACAPAAIGAGMTEASRVTLAGVVLCMAVVWIPEHAWTRVAELVRRAWRAIKSCLLGMVHVPAANMRRWAAGLLTGADRGVHAAAPQEAGHETALVQTPRAAGGSPWLSWAGACFIELRGAVTSPPMVAALAGACFILALRFLGSLFGIREELQLPGFVRVSMSIFFVPLTLLVFSPLLAQAQAGWRSRCEEAAAALVLGASLAIGIAAASWVVSDDGFFIYALAPILGAAVAYAGSGSRTRSVWNWPIAIAAVTPPLAMLLCVTVGVDKTLLWGLGALAVAMLSVTLIVRPVALWLAPAAAAAGLTLMIALVENFSELSNPNVALAKAVSLKTNDLRLLAALDPSQLEAVGTRGAYDLQNSIDHMRDYSSTVLGRGYFELPTPTLLLPFHLTDNVSAIHLMSPFGRLGALALVFALAALVLVTVGRAMSATPTARRWSGVLAAMTLLLVSAYMILANLPAVPFTGRNVYLLAASSTSDLIEGLLLFVLAVSALGIRPPAEPAP